MRHFLACDSVSRKWSFVDATLKQRIVDAFYALPDGCRHPAASEDELAAFEADFSSIPAEFRWFLADCGGGAVGSDWVDGIDELRDSHRKFDTESSADGGWTMRDVFVIGWDGSGNPFGIHTTTGKLVVEDHGFGGIYHMANSFSDFLAGRLLSLPLSPL